MDAGARTIAVRRAGVATTQLPAMILATIKPGAAGIKHIHISASTRHSATMHNLKVSSPMNAALIAQAKMILPGALLAIVAAAMTITDAYATAPADEVAIHVFAGTRCSAIALNVETKVTRSAGFADDSPLHATRHPCADDSKS